MSSLYPVQSDSDDDNKHLWTVKERATGFVLGNAKDRSSSSLNYFFKIRNKDWFVIRNIVQYPWEHTLTFDYQLRPKYEFYALKRSTSDWTWDTYRESQTRVLHYVYGYSLENYIAYDPITRNVTVLNRLIIINGITYRLIENPKLFSLRSDHLQVYLEAVPDIQRQVVKQIRKLYKGPQSNLNMIFSYLWFM